MILEQELNDSVVQPQFVARLSAGDELTVLGDVSDSAGDYTDAFEFVAIEPLSVGIVLTAEQSEDAEPEIDLDLFVYDGFTFVCPGEDEADPLYSQCLDGDENPTVGTVTATDSFVLVVAAADGAAQYQLDITVSAAATGTALKGDAEGARHHGGPPLQYSGRIDRTSGSQDDFVPGELLIAFHDGIRESQRRETFRKYGLRLIEASPSACFESASLVIASRTLRFSATLQWKCWAHCVTHR